MASSSSALPSSLSSASASAASSSAMGSGILMEQYKARNYNSMVFPSLFTGVKANSSVGVNATTGFIEINAPNTLERFELLLRDNDNLHGLVLIVQHIPLVDYSPVVLGLRVALDCGDVFTGFALAKHRITPRMLGAFAGSRTTVQTEASADIKKALAQIGVERAQNYLRRLSTKDKPPARDDAAAFERFVMSDFALLNNGSDSEADEDAGTAANYAFLDEQVPVVKRGKKVGSRSDKAAATAASVAKKITPPPAASGNDDDSGGGEEPAAATAASSKKASKKAKKPSSVGDDEAAATAAAPASAALGKKRARDADDDDSAVGGHRSGLGNDGHAIPSSQVIAHLAPYDHEGMRRCAVYGCDRAQTKGDSATETKKTGKGVLKMEHRLWNDYAMVAMCCKEHCRADLPEHGTACIMCRRGRDTVQLMVGEEGTQDHYLHYDVSYKTITPATKPPTQRAAKPMVLCLSCASKATTAPLLEANHYQLAIEGKGDEFSVLLDRRSADRPGPSEQDLATLRAIVAGMDENAIDIKPVAKTVKRPAPPVAASAAAAAASSSSSSKAPHKTSHNVANGKRDNNSDDDNSDEPEPEPMDEDKTPAPPVAKPAKPAKAAAAAKSSAATLAPTTPTKPKPAGKSPVPKAILEALEQQKATNAAAPTTPSKKPMSNLLATATLAASSTAPAAAAAPALDVSSLFAGDADDSAAQAAEPAAAAESVDDDGADLLALVGFQ